MRKSWSPQNVTMTNRKNIYSTEKLKHVPEWGLTHDQENQSSYNLR